MNHEIWVLEDDAAVRQVITQTLDGKYRYREFDSIEGFQSALAGADKPSLLIADLQIARTSFLTFLEQCKEPLCKKFPFVVVTGADDLDLFEKCMAKGAADYITKPFGRAALLGKIGRFLAKSEVPFTLDPSTFVAESGSTRSKTLTSKEFQILTTLRAAPQMTLTRSEIQHAVWADLHVGNKTFDVHLYNLRRKIEDLGINIEFDAPNRYRIVTSATN